MSGVNLSGKSSIKIGGFEVTLSTPPPELKISIYGNGSSDGLAGYADSQTACMIGSGGSGYAEVSIKDESGNFYLFIDKKLTIPLSPGWYWTDDTTNIGGNFDPTGFSILVDPTGLIVALDRCRGR